MKKITSTVFTVVAVSIALTATMAKAVNTVTLYKGSYSYSVGGEFTAITSQNYLGNYSSSAEQSETMNGKSVTGFQTFCLETGVPFTSGKSYSYTTGLSTAPDGGAAGSGISLSVGAAYLYYEFGTGNLTGYNYANTGKGDSRVTDAGLLQAAIWWFQGNQTYSGFVGSKGHPSITTDPFYALAISALGSLANAMSAYTGTSVEVMQLFNSNGTPAQAQLVLTGHTTPSAQPSSVPDGGMTAALLGLGLVGMFAIKSWQRKPA
jgi:hypothetical protein